MTIEVLLVEDNKDLAVTVADYLALEGMNIDYAANGKAGLNLAQQNRYDVLVLDINLPQINGLDVCSTLRNEGSNTPVLMLTAKDTLNDKLAGFDAGTNDYLIKPFALPELAARIRALGNHGRGLSQKLQVGDLHMDVEHKTVFRAGQKITLSPMGWSILELLMRESPRVVSRQRLEQYIWPTDTPDTNSLKVHLYRLRLKIDKPFETPLIHTVAGHGFAIRSDD